MSSAMPPIVQIFVFVFSGAFAPGAGTVIILVVVVIVVFIVSIIPILFVNAIACSRSPFVVAIFSEMRGIVGSGYIARDGGRIIRFVIVMPSPAQCRGRGSYRNGVFMIVTS
jgi:hypothetical protein